MGYEGSLPTLRRHSHTLKAPSAHLTKTTLRYETPPGKQAQADWMELYALSGREAPNLQFAHFPYLKRLDQFDYVAQSSLDPRLIEELATRRYLNDGGNIVLLGLPGVGKTQLAIAVGVRVAEMGHRGYFTTVMDFARTLTQAVDSSRLQRARNALQPPRLLIINEIGYPPFAN